MNSNAELQKAIEDTLVQIGKDNAKIMSAQLVALVEQIRNGGPSKVTLIWEALDTPMAIKELIYSDAYRAKILNEHHGFYYAILLPTGRTSFPDMFTGYCTSFIIDLPQNKLIVYY
jgi:hypothetical protein